MVYQIIMIIILIGLNAYFAAIEMAFISVNDVKISKQAKEGNKKAKQVEKMLDNPSEFLATIQIGITLVGFLSSAFASTVFASKLGPVLYILFPTINIEVWNIISIFFITIILSYFTLVFGELVPKRLAMKYSGKIAFASIKTIKIISLISLPFVKLLTFSTNIISKAFGVGENEDEIVTEDEIKIMISEGLEKGTIEKEEKELINKVFRFNDIVVSEIMIPRTQIFAMSLKDDIHKLISQIDELKYSRIPVYKDNMDNIEGILFLKDILKNFSEDKEKLELGTIIRQPYFVPYLKPIDELFRELQKNKQQMAVVIDEYGGTAGIVTMEDIIEELLGNILDEYDDDIIEYIKIDENTYMVDGSITIDNFNQVFNIEIQNGDYDTLSGYILSKIGKIPTNNENILIEDDKLIYKVEKIEDKRIKSIKVCKK